MTNDITNKEFRNKLRKDPYSVLNYINTDIDIIVKTNTKDTVYLVIPDMSDNNIQELSQISAAGTASSAGSASTASSVSSIVGSLSTISSGGSLSCLGTST